NGGPADGHQVLGFPAVAAEERNIDTELAGLQCNEPDVLVIGGDENGLGIGGLDGGQLRVEILVPAAEFLFVKNSSAGGAEGILEISGQADAIGAGGIGQDGDFFDLQSVESEFGEDTALQR